MGLDFSQQQNSVHRKLSRERKGATRKNLPLVLAGRTAARGQPCPHRSHWGHHRAVPESPPAPSALPTVPSSRYREGPPGTPPLTVTPVPLLFASCCCSQATAAPTAATAQKVPGEREGCMGTEGGNPSQPLIPTSCHGRGGAGPLPKAGAWWLWGMFSPSPCLSPNPAGGGDKAPPGITFGTEPSPCPGNGTRALYQMIPQQRVVSSFCPPWQL